MTEEQFFALSSYEVDYHGAIVRFSDDEQLYVFCLTLFLTDPTMKDLNDSVISGSWDSAFTQAHALKGVAANLGLIPLMHSTSQLLINIREGKTGSINHYLELVNEDYQKVIEMIKTYFI